MGVDVLEAGFPASSTGSFKSVEAIAKTLTTTAVCGLARCKKSDIDAVYEATKRSCKTSSNVHCIHSFATSYSFRT